MSNNPDDPEPPPTSSPGAGDEQPFLDDANLGESAPETDSAGRSSVTLDNNADRKEPRRKKKRRWRGQWVRWLTLFVLAVSASLVYSQMRDSWRQSQLAYLQTRGQDFIAFEYESESLGCLYNWWTPRQSGRRATLLPYARSNTPAALQCASLFNDYDEYARSLLYIEEALMYLVEAARITCDMGVDYGEELKIWRADIVADSTGAFSFYILNRFGDSTLRYSSPLDADYGATESVTNFVLQARLFGASLSGMCRRAARFESSLAFQLEPESWVEEICTNPDPRPIGLEYASLSPSHVHYCSHVHNQDSWFVRASDLAFHGRSGP